MGRLQVHVLANSGLLKTEVKTVPVELGRLSESRCGKTQTNHFIEHSTGECTKLSTKSNYDDARLFKLSRTKPHKKTEYFSTNYPLNLLMAVLDPIDRVQPRSRTTCVGWWARFKGTDSIQAVCLVSYHAVVPLQAELEESSVKLDRPIPIPRNAISFFTGRFTG